MSLLKEVAVALVVSSHGADESCEGQQGQSFRRKHRFLLTSLVEARQRALL
jgi:hypothetical protein